MEELKKIDNETLEVKSTTTLRVSKEMLVKELEKVNNIILDTQRYRDSLQAKIDQLK